MNRSARPDGLHLDTSDPAPSSAIDRTSMSPSFSLRSIPSVSPEPAYIAPASAANLVTSEFSVDFDLNPNEGVSVSPGSLSLINTFLDRLLFNFLSRARSTSLASLRPAVVDVLKPKLATEAIIGADEELQEYLGTDDELEAFHNGEEPPLEWDLDSIWKRARLRCMLYTRLGDMEEGDEEMYLAQEGLSDANGRPPRDISMVTPPVAIFLTSVLEFVGEHALLIAVRAAYKRVEAKTRQEGKDMESLQKIVVEEVDMEKVGLNPTLGRLWRSWRKLVRSPRNSLSRISREVVVGQRGMRAFSVGSISRRSSVATADSQQLMMDPDHVPSVGEVLDGPDPSLIPLPSNDHDVGEIEVPGYSPELALRNKSVEGRAQHGRPMSMLIPAQNTNQVPSSLSPLAETVASSDATTPQQQFHTPLGRLRRSHSLPTPQTPFFPAPEGPDSDLLFNNQQEGFMPENDALEPAARRTPSVIARESRNSRDSPPSRDYNNSSQKPRSAPSTPHQSSMLKEVGGSYDRTYYTDGSDDQSENDPAEGALQFDQNDYKIDDSERATGATAVPYPDLTLVPKPLNTPFSPSDSLRGSPAPGEVSPIGHASIGSGEVSPIELSDDELQAQTKPTAPTKHNDPEIYTGVGYRPPVTQGRSPPPQPKLVDYGPRGPQPARQRRKAGPTEDDYAKDEKREAFVIPEDTDTMSSRRPASDSSSLSGKDLQADGTILNKRLRNFVPDGNGAPNLGPLREMMEAAHDTSDEASSLAPSQADYASRAASMSPSAPVNSKSVTPSNRAADLRRQLPTVYTTPVLDRATAQRASPIAKRDASTRQSRSSESSFPESRTASIVPVVRPISVKGKSRGGSLSGDHYRDSLPSRTSSDGSRSAYDEKYNRSSTGTSDRQKSFEQLMNSGETIQYTLTPQNMREIEGRDAQVITQVPPVSTTTTSGRPVSTPRSVRTSIERTSPKQSRTAPPPSQARGQNATSPTSNKVPTFVIHSGPTIKRGPQAVPRDARVELDNTRDFADFIRSTGPDPVRSSAGPLRTGPSQLPNARGGGKSPLRSHTVASPPKAARSSTLRGKPRLEAREPTTRNTKSSELIDFLKQGPPSDRGSGGGRAVRSMAASRTTMDSEDMPGPGQGKSRDTYSVTSTQDSFMTKSIQSSTNSRTGLLDSARNPSKMSAAADKRSNRHDDDEGAPVRTRRRVKDPYAIPDSDEDEDDEILHTPKAQREEESLMDFLNSVPPPQAGNTPPPLEIPKSATKSLQRKSSGPSMRSRFASGSKDPSINSKDLPLSPGRVGTARSTPIKTQYDTATIRGEGEGSPQLSKQTGNARAGYPPRSQASRQQYGSHMASENGRANGVRPARRQMSARTERDDTGMGDLADFLKNSGPPEMPPSFPASPPVKDKEEGGFSRMFSRKKSKNAAVG